MNEYTPWEAEGITEVEYWKARYIEQRARLAKAIEVLRWYGEGGHPAKDMWEHPELGHFTGKRARRTVAELGEV